MGSSIKAPYDADLSALSPTQSRSIVDLPWLGPREVAEAHPWPMLSLGGTPSADLPAHIVDAARRSAAHPKYPGTLGDQALREAIAERVGPELGIAVDPDSEVLVTVGSMHALHLAATVCTRLNGRAIAHAPAFFYRDIASAAGGICDWTGGEDGPPDWVRFTAALDKDVSTVFVNTPVNPTGYVFTEQDLEALAAAVHGRPVWVVSDEAYQAYVYDGAVHLSPAAHPDLRSKTLVVRSFSKTYALGAWRVGFAVGPAALISSMAKLLQYTVIGVASVVQAAALAAYIGPQDWASAIWTGLGRTRLQVVDAINGTGVLTTVVPQAGTTVWARLPDGSDEDSMSRWLGRDYGIPAVQGRLFGSMTPHVRIPFAGASSAAGVLLERLVRLREDAASGGQQIPIESTAQ